MTRARSDRKGRVPAAALLASASLAALLAGMPAAAADDCGGHVAPPADLATPSMLYNTLRTHTNAQLLAIGFLRKEVAEACAWIYEVKVLTASGSVVELDFDAAGLELVGARGPNNDRDAAALVRTFGGDSSILTIGANKGGDHARGSGTASNSGNGSSGGGGGHGGDDGGEGGNSGTGGDNSGPGGGEGGDSDGGEGGEGGGDGSGDGGEGGGDD
jgi:hypothetical protein